jgi:hypothetical protein
MPYCPLKTNERQQPVASHQRPALLVDRPRPLRDHLGDVVGFLLGRAGEDGIEQGTSTRSSVLQILPSRLIIHPLLGPHSQQACGRRRSTIHAWARSVGERYVPRSKHPKAQRMPNNI